MRPQDVAYGNIVEVWSINRSPFINRLRGYKRLNTWSLVLLQFRNNNFSLWEYRPIRITPEILRLCGFDQIDKYTWRRGRNFVHHRVRKDVYKCRGAVINYLHELQNVWRWTSREELPITPHDLARIRERFPLAPGQIDPRI